MKKYLLGSFAIVLAIIFSAFTQTTVKPIKYETSYYYFNVNSGAGGNSMFANTDVTYIEFGTSTAQGSCNTGSKKCKIGFNAGDVQETFPGSGVYELTSGTHSPAVVPWTRTTQ